MPFDNTATQDRAELVATVSNIVKVFDNAANAADKAADSKAAACDAILASVPGSIKRLRRTALSTSGWISAPPMALRIPALIRRREKRRRWTATSRTTL